MKKIKNHTCRLLFFFVLLSGSFSGLGQEICNNGIDDDGDGRIDLNDSVECICGAGVLPVPSLITNPSFEAMSICPDWYSELTRASGWFEGTSTTPDYLNTCGFTFSASIAGLLPFPDGNGATGSFYINDYKEYIGTCLPSLLLAGHSYKLTFHIAASLVSPAFSLCGSINGVYAPVDVTLFGAPSCTNLPSYTFACPIAGDPAWIPLGSISYTPVQSWNLVSMTFTPSVNIKSIMLGPPCVLPISYQQIELTTDCLPYFYYDNLILNESDLFNQAISISGTSCTDPVVLTANLTHTVSPGALLQWYQNGIAIVGATSATYSVAAGSASGTYQVRLTDGSRCAVSAGYAITSGVPLADFSGIVNPTVMAGTTLQLLNQSSSALTYQWEFCDGSSSTSTSVAVPLTDTGSCCIKLIAYNFPCRDSVTKCIRVVSESQVVIPNVFTPNGDQVNDVFKIKSSGLKEINCSIYDRWGLKLYEWDDVNGFWDGKTAFGNAPAGTYFFVVRYTGSDSKAKTEKGFLTLFRD